MIVYILLCSWRREYVITPPVSCPSRIILSDIEKMMETTDTAASDKTGNLTMTTSSSKATIYTVSKILKTMCCREATNQSM